MHFQLFFPGRTSNGRQCLADAGLADMASGISEAVVTINDVRGMLIAWKGDAVLDADRQQWLDFEGVPYKVGLWRDGPVTPADLKKPAFCGGVEMLLGDGNKWLIPRAAWLPAHQKRVQNKWALVRKAQYDQFWNESEVWFKRLMDHNGNVCAAADAEGSTVERIIGELCDFAVTALRLNYQLPVELVSELTLLDNDNVFDLLSIVTGFDLVLEAMGKMREQGDAVAAGLEKKVTDGSSPLP